jgi:hypothetical protein
MSEIDLTKQPPWSPRLTLNGLVGLPRLIEKARAAKFGQLGSYKFGSDSSLDKEILEFVGLPAEKFLSLVERIKSEQSWQNGSRQQLLGSLCLRLLLRRRPATRDF